MIKNSETLNVSDVCRSPSKDRYILKTAPNAACFTSLTTLESTITTLVNIPRMVDLVSLVAVAPCHQDSNRGQ